MFSRAPRFQEKEPDSTPGPNSYDPKSPQANYKKGGMFEKDGRFKEAKQSDVGRTDENTRRLLVTKNGSASNSSQPPAPSANKDRLRLEERLKKAESKIEDINREKISEANLRAERETELRLANQRESKLQFQLEKSEKMISSLKEKSRSAITAASIESKLETLQKMHEKEKASLANLNGELDSTRSKLSESERSKDAAKKDLESERKKNGELKDKVIKLEKRNEDKIREMEKITIANQEAREEVKKMNREIEEVNITKKDLEAENQVLNQKILISGEENLQLQNQLKEVNERFESSKEVSVVVEDLKQEIKNLEEDNRSLKKNLEILSKVASRSFEDQDEVKSELKDQSLSIQLSQIRERTLRSQVEILDQENHDLAEQVQLHQEQLEIQNEFISELQRDLNLDSTQLSRSELQVDQLLQNSNELVVPSLEEDADELKFLSNFDHFNSEIISSDLSFSIKTSESYLSSLETLQELYLSKVQEFTSIQEDFESFKSDTESKLKEIESKEQKMNSLEIQFENSKKERLEAVKQRNEAVDERDRDKALMREVVEEKQRLEERNKGIENRVRELEVDYGNALTREDAEREEKDRLTSILQDSNDWESSYHSLYKEAQILLSRSALAESDVQHLTSLNLKLVSPKTNENQMNKSVNYASNNAHLNSERVSYLNRIHSERDEARQALLRMAVEKDELEDQNQQLKKELGLFKSFRNEDVHRISVRRQDPRARLLSRSKNGKEQGNGKLNKSFNQVQEGADKGKGREFSRTVGPGIEVNQVALEDSEVRVRTSPHSHPPSSNSSPSLLEPNMRRGSGIRPSHPIQSTPIQPSGQGQLPPRRKIVKGRRSSLLVKTARKSMQMREMKEESKGWSNHDGSDDEEMTLEELER